LPTRELGSWNLAGWSRLLWTEIARDFEPGRLRGARLDAALPPSPAPVVTATLPARVPRTRTAMLRFRVPVRCSQACDARLSLVGSDGVEWDHSVRALPAGRRVVLRLRGSDDYARRALSDAKYRRPRLRLLVADRAGHVEARSRTLRVRVIERPVRAFKVRADHDFAMFSARGNRAVARLVNSLIEGLAAGQIRSERELRRRFLAGARAIERAGFDELGDTEVRDAIFVALEVPCARFGFSAEAVVSG
jgi:hypothetical protein